MKDPETNLNAGKKEYVRNMFNSIARRYDFLNHFLSMNIDLIWRKKVIAMLKPFHPQTILDIATGTADLAIQATVLHPKKIIGIDISEEMLKIGQKKLNDKNKEGIIQLMNVDAETMPFENESFDACMVAFGVRNFEDLQQGLSEMYRVLNTNGQLVILEFSKPTQFPVKQIYGLYFSFILPFIGKLVSKSNDAYIYLPDSVGKFPSPENFILLLNKVGFTAVSVQKLSFGIASIYFAVK